MQLYLDEPSVKVGIHQQRNMETVFLNRRANNKIEILLQLQRCEEQSVMEEIQVLEQH
jgi:hypothetical protein